MKLLNKTQGAVSIFLVIILVPMMTVSALFVDAGKVRLARGVQEAAGDLALNTALTDYDTQLKDLYGLFATAQDTTELYGKLENYYRTSIMSSGIAAEDADDFVDTIMGQLKSVSSTKDISDLLNMQLVDFNVSKRADASLENSTILKKQVVEFMKYRSPINTGLSFLSSLQSFATLSKQTELVDKRTEYYKEQNKVLEDLKTAWDHITKYNGMELITDEQYFQKIKDALDGKYKQTYQDVNRETIMNLYDTQDYADYKCSLSYNDATNVTKPQGGSGATGLWKISLVLYGEPYTYSSFDSLNKYNKSNLPKSDVFLPLMKQYMSAKDEMKTTKASVTSLNSPADRYDLQYLVQAGRSHQLKEYTYDVADLYSVFQSLKHAHWWLDGYPPEERNEIGNTTISFNGQTKTIDQHFMDIEDDFNRTMQDEQKWVGLFSNISQSVNGLTNYASVDSKVNEIGKKMGDYRNTLNAAAEHLDKARKSIEDAKKAVDADGKLSEARENWSNAASDSSIKNTSMAKQDLAELDELDNYLNPQDMQKMITRLKHVADNLRATAKQIESYKFDGVFIGDIQSYDSLKNTIENAVTRGVLTDESIVSKGALEALVAKSFNWEEKKVDIKWINDSGTQIKLHGQGSDKLNFYSYLYAHFNDNSGPVTAKTTSTKKESKSEGKNVFKSIKKKSEGAAKDEAGKTSSKAKKEIIDQKEIPSKNTKAKGETKGADKIESGEDSAKKTSSNLSGMFDVLVGKLEKMGTQVRDNMFVSDYILSMFSYDTIVSECANKSEENPEPRTLTREPINDKNNFAYQAEVEYILYGNKNAENIAKAYASIYAIRLGFNLIYAFTSSSIRDTAFALATPISAATLGVIPVPLIQAAIIAAVSCCESGIDLADLRKGEKVPLFKNDRTWHVSINGMVQYAKGEAKEVVKNATSVVITESQEVLIELLDKTDEELTQNINESSERLQSAIDATYDTLIARHADTAIQKLTTLANQAIDEAASKGIDDIPLYVEKQLIDWGNKGDSGDIGNLAKKEAVNYIVSSGTIGELVSTLKETANGQIIGAGDKLDGILQRLRKDISDKVVQGNQLIINKKEQVKQKAASAINDGAESLRNTVNEQLDGLFGDTASAVDGTEDNTGLASLLSFQYSDYLRLFLMIGMFTNENAVITRLADVIQVNMEIPRGNAGYRLKKSAVYVNIATTVQVPPTFLALPLFADVEGNPAGDARWYTMEYKDIRGY